MIVEPSAGRLECDVAIIGSGPAGLAAAVELRRRGVPRVSVFEREVEPGGIPRHCAHPPYGVREYGRLLTGPGYARRNVKAALAAGVEIHTRHTVVALKAGGELELTTPDGLLTAHARRVLIAVGARETPRSARLIGGERPAGVINTGTLQSCLYLEHRKPFARPLIVGSELVSLSAVMSCRRAGIRPVAMIEAAERPTARWPLTLFPRLCGVPLHLGTRLERIEGTSRVEAAHIRFEDGRLERLACDGIVLTGQFTPEASLLRLSHLAVDFRSGGPQVDQFARCSDPAYFAAGNLLRPIETAGWSYREGVRIAGYLADDLVGELNAESDAIPVQCSDPVRYCLPQRLIPNDQRGLDHLQLRMSRPVHGALHVHAGERTLWRRSGTFLPERRILIPRAELDLRGVTALKVGFREEHGG